MAFTWERPRIPWVLICMMSLKITFLKWLPYFPGTNELSCCITWRIMLDICHVYLENEFVVNIAICMIHCHPVGEGWCLFLRWWPPSSMWVGHLIFLSTTTGNVWIIPSFRIWGYVLHVEHTSCVITNCDQHQWVIIFCTILISFPYFLLLRLLLQGVAQFQTRG